MYIPKFIRKAILGVVGYEIPVSVRNFPRESLIGFTENEIDEIILGSSYKRIVRLKKLVIEEIDKFIHEEALSRGRKK